MSEIDKINSLLDEKIPRDVVSLRDGGGGRKLSYLEGWYVIDRLNKIFGPLGWSKEIIDVRQVVNTTKNGEFPAYLVKVRLLVHPEGSVKASKEGYGYGADKSGLNAHELAIKEAVTDALKVAAKDLGMSMGLALYDKSQENVSDESSTDRVPISNTKPVDTQTPETRGNSPLPATSNSSEKETDSKELETTIRSYVRVAEKQRRLTGDEFKTYLRDKQKAERLNELSNTQLHDTLNYLRQLTK